MEKVKNRIRIMTIIFFIIAGIILFLIDYSNLGSRDNYPMYIMTIGVIIGYIAITVTRHSTLI